MAEEIKEAQEVQGGMTIGHLLMAMAFLMPVIFVFGDVKGSGGGALRYALGVPSGLGIGAMIVFQDWHLGKYLWLRTRKFSTRVQNVVGVGGLALDVVWIVVGCFAGSELASMLIRFL